MLIADNAMSEHFGGGVVFMDTSDRQRVITGDRTAFIGRNRTLATARGLSGIATGRVGAALDPCGVIQVAVTLGRRGDARGRRSCSATPPTWTPRVALAAAIPRSGRRRAARATGRCRPGTTV